MKALDEHMSAGRLTVDEYADRSAAASVATTRAELAALFADLPEPHPALCAPPVARPAAPPAPRDPGIPLFGAAGPRLVAVTPILAVVLFFATNQFFDYAWLFFLLIPAMGAIVYGRGHEEQDRRRHRRLH